MGPGEGIYLREDLKLLVELGQRLDEPAYRMGVSWRQFLIGILLRIRDRHGNLKELVPNRAQAEYERRCGRRNIVLKARQLGMTTWIAARFFINTVTRPGSLSVQVAHDQASAEGMFRIVHRFLENLPERLRGGALLTSRANVGQLVFPSLDSEYRVETAADPNAGRGLTIHNLHCSEVARWPRDGEATLVSLRAAVPPEGEVVLESTPNGAGGCFYDEWQRAPQTGYVTHFFPWWWEAEYALTGAKVREASEEEVRLIEGFGVTEEQIAFRRRMRASFRELWGQEFAEDPISCFLASRECVFDMEAVEKRLTELSAPRAGGAGTAAEERDNGRLLIWWPPRPKGEYILGADPAGGGSGGDYACIQVVERTSGLQCAEWQGHFPPQQLATRVASLGREYNNAVAAVERNNHGYGVLAHLDASEHYPEIYEQRNQPGWLTSAVTRPRMIEHFAALLSSAPQLFSSPRLLAECRTFVRHADGTAAAARGAHDDCVLAMAIALAVRQELSGRPRGGGQIELGSMARD